MTDGCTLHDLTACLAGLPAVELRGMALLRECRPSGALFPTGVPRQQLIDAITEITAYTARVRALTHALARLPAVPLRDQPVPEVWL